MKDYKDPQGIPPSFYRCKIVEPLEIKNNLGYITINTGMMTGTVFTANDNDYLIRQLMRIDGFGNYKIEISKCNGNLENEDKQRLSKNTIIKAIYTPVRRPDFTDGL